MHYRILHRIFLFIAFTTLAQSVAAQGFENCTKAEVATATAAITDAKRVSLNAAAAVGDTPEFTRWFGKYAPETGEVVRANLKAIVGAVRSGTITTICENVGFDGCDPGTYAFVNATQPYRVHLCPSFFRMPSLNRLDPDQSSGENGSQTGTIIHELSHFRIVARTDDNCYARTVCSRMAQRNSVSAVHNADSYQYYAEDVTLALRAIQGVANSR